MRGHKEFRVTCTDKGTHPPRELALFAPVPPHDESGAWVGDEDDLGSTWAEWDLITERNSTGVAVYGNVRAVTTDAGKLWRFRCPTCRRDAPIRDADLGRVVLTFIGAGFDRLDISTR